jgi:hypothetical protein
VLLAATIIWGISRMGPRSAPLIEADGRPFRVRPENMPPPPPVTPPTSGRSQARPDQAARLAPAPEAPRTDALRQQMEAAAAPPAPPPATAPAAAPSPPPASGMAASTAAAPRPPAARAAVTPPAAATARPAPPASSAATAGRAEVQFAALVSEDAAKLEWDRLKRRVPALTAMQPRITRVERNGQPPLWRLRVSTADAAAARSLCEQARAKNAPCVPV